MSLPLSPLAAFPPASRADLPHLLLPAVAAAALASWLMGSGADLWLADHLYAAQGGHWAARNSWWARAAIHDGGRALCAAVALATPGVWLASWRVPSLHHLRRPLACLLLSAALSSALVSVLKGLTQMDCPWDLQRYGGLRPYVGLLAHRDPGLGAAACFPAGHASAGYAWLALYFVLATLRPRWRWAGLAVPLAAGAVFGITQQWRGAHFLSHDLWTLAICWTVAVLLSRAMLRNGTGVAVPRLAAAAQEAA